MTMMRIRRMFKVFLPVCLFVIVGCQHPDKSIRVISQSAEYPAVVTPDEVADLATAIKDPNETVDGFANKVRAVVKGRKLLGLTRPEVEKRIGLPTSSDWFVHLSKPRFGGDRLRYGFGDFRTYASLGLFMRAGKVYSCVLWVRKNGRLIEEYQESSGAPIKVTWN